MKTGNRLSSGNLMLLELVFAIIFFCLAMAASMSVFGNAYEMSSRAEDQDAALRETDSAAEIIRSSETKEEMDSLLTAAGFTGSMETGYEKLVCDDRYRLTISLSESGKLIQADMLCYSAKDGTQSEPMEPFYDLSIKHALKGGL